MITNDGLNRVLFECVSIFQLAIFYHLWCANRTAEDWNRTKMLRCENSTSLEDLGMRFHSKLRTVGICLKNLTTKSSVSICVKSQAKCKTTNLNFLLDNGACQPKNNWKHNKTDISSGGHTEHFAHAFEQGSLTFLPLDFLGFCWLVGGLCKISY